jgi:UDP-N-acetylmuramoyl-tripeptide--D-alanyl-D-alanine ligase
MAVIEMGANHQGEIGFLCTISQPSHGLITNIGKAHLEGFGGIEGVKKGKSELYRYLAQHDGIVFINLSEAFLDELAQPVEQKVYYQQASGASFYKKNDYGFELKGWTHW